MTPWGSHWFERSRRGASVAAVLASLVVGLPSWAAVSSAQGMAASSPARSVSKPVTEQGVRWRDLKPGQQAVLKPLEQDWSSISTTHKQKWIELSAGFSKRSPADQARIQERMTEWVRLTPQQRSQARLNFQEAKQINATERKARWDAYQALPAEQKQQLAERAAPTPTTKAQARLESSGRESQAKSNIVPNPALAAPPKVVAPTIVQARPGATTTLITKRPTPPSHQQTGLPKIAATPEFVNKATLLPQRGPQGAATRSAATPATGPSAAQ